jgi:hypothetical protein
LQEVSGPKVEVHSGTGRIRYLGDPGQGFYKLMTGTGNIDVAVPFAGLAHFKARSVKGKVDHQILGPPLAGLAGQSSSLLHAAAAAFELHSLRGNISVREASK